MDRKSIGLDKEIAAWHRDISDKDLRREVERDYPNSAAVLKYMQSGLFYADFLHAFQASDVQPKIIDVGCGYGFTSVYLASVGYEVVALDPSPFNCRYIKVLAQVCGVKLKAMSGTAEDMDSLFIKGSVDYVLFHSSLHHCDFPERALRNAWSLLRPEGMVLLVCEPTLPIFRTKRWFHRMLIENPGRVGHYGGNEHIYRIAEYERMLKVVGFGDVRVRIGPSMYGGWSSPEEPPIITMIRRGYYKVMRFLDKVGLTRTVKWALDGVSLGPRIFIGRR